MELLLPIADGDGSLRIRHINSRAQLQVDGDACSLVVHGIPVFWWHAEDRVSQSYAMVLLVENGVSNPTEVKAAFGVARMTLYRALARFRDEGLLGLVHAKSGPREPHALGRAAARRMLEAKTRGESNVRIAARLGVTEGAIRHALRREGYQAAVPVQVTFEQALSSAREPVLPPAQVDAPESPSADAVENPDAAVAAVGEAGALPASGEETSVATEAGRDVPLTAPEVATAGGPAASGQADVVGGDPWDRTLDRTMAALGMINEAPPQFGDCENVTDLGVLLAMPALVQSGVFDVATKAYAGFGAAFYGVRTVFLCLALMALQRIKRPEQLRHHSPPALGRALGLDRAPEVKTLRRRLRDLADQKHSEAFMREFAKRRVESHSDAMGFLYVDGHVRPYCGKASISKQHVTRMRLSMPATTDHWVNDRDGEPLLVLTATPTTSLAKEMLAIAREVRQLLGDRRVTVVFDRGGWSPKLFAELIKLNFDILTYRKGRIPKVRISKFTTHKGTFDGRDVSYQLAERSLVLKYRGGKLKLREVVRLSDDGSHQTSIVTSRTDLSAVEVAYRMFERWRQENFFKYMKCEFSIDALNAYGTEDDDPERDVPNPARKAQERKLVDARAEVARLERVLGAAAADNDEAKRPSMRGFKIANGSVGQQLRAARDLVDKLKAGLRGIPTRTSARDAAKEGKVVRLKTETKRLTDTMKSVAYQAETALYRMVRPHYQRHEDEGRKLIAAAFQLTGDIQVGPGELRITLNPAASPNRTSAIAALCVELSATDTAFPGTQLRLHYAIREA